MATKQVICDTDVIIDYWDRANTRHNKTKNILEEEIGLDNVVISGITQMELLLGAINKSDLSKITKSLTRFHVILVSNDINLKAFDLIRSYTLSHGLAIPDSLIAATTITTDLELFTYNTKDYKFIEGLKLFNSKK
jgi:predicted nucleic acid-binding protein